MVEMIEDPRRVEPAMVGLGEREMLDGWLEFHRVTLLLKCEGLDDAQRKALPVATSKLSLHGLVRHMAEVERGWFQRTLLANPGLPLLYADDDEEDRELVPLDDADWDADLAVWQEQIALAREAAGPLDLDHVGQRRNGTPVSLRWIYTHMIEEYARHNGHADLIRELIDGSVGD